MFDEYRKISGREIEDSIKREMSGSLEDVFLAVGESLPHASLTFVLKCRNINSLVVAWQ